jgi:hypothetical protein
MAVDISKIKPGDKVTLVPLEVRRVDGAGILVFATPENPYATANQIAAHHPAPRDIVVGDRVRIGEPKGEVVHIFRGRAWVLWDEGDESIWPVPDLTLVEGDQ